MQRGPTWIWRLVNHHGVHGHDILTQKGRHMFHNLHKESQVATAFLKEGVVRM